MSDPIAGDLTPQQLEDEAYRKEFEQRALGAFRPRYWLHGLLFALTFATTTIMAVAYFVFPPAQTYADLFLHFASGLKYSIPLLVFLSAHEFGHYFAARHHRVQATLPYYIPAPFMLFGTMGAVIRIRTQIPNRKALFDIGIAGPLAGFVVALAYLIIGALTAPGVESLLAIHPEYRGLAVLPDSGLHFGGMLLIDLIGDIVAHGRFFPPMNEIYHYPLLCVGWFGMFVTSLNLIPVGQLDGGHILYSMVGKRQPAISRWFVAFMVFAGLGGAAGLLLDAVRGHHPHGILHLLQMVFLTPLEWVASHASWWLRGWLGWLLWAAIVRFFVRIPHPPVPDDSPLGTGRLILGWLSMVILILTFSFTGIYEITAAIVLGR